MADIHGHSHAHSHSHPRRVSLSAHPGPGTSGGDHRNALSPQRRASVGDMARPGGAGATGAGVEGITDIDVGEYREQDRFLPIANVSRLMKAAVPPSTKIGKDAKECVQECVSEFISFLTSEAAERSLLEKRKTIGGEDILHAMGTLGFDNYAEVLRIYLAKLREHQSAAGARAEQYIEPRGEGM